VLGPSGSGKSSLVQAGVIPQLRVQGQLIALFTPSQQPLTELAFTLQTLFEQSGNPHPAEQLLARLQESCDALPFIVRELIQAADSKGLCLVIDQFEELFTLTNVDEREAFVNTLCQAAQQTADLVKIIFTMRSDFIGQCVVYPALNQLITSHLIQVGPMDKEALKQAIEAPAQLAELTLEVGLLQRILDDIAGASSELPLLEHALLELFERRRGSLLTLSAYVEIGGIEGALAKRAESEYERLDENDKQTIRKLFILGLIHPGEGTEDTRRRATKEELLAIGSDSEKTEALLNHWIQARLLTSYHDEARDTDMVDVAHELLIRKWPRIQQWVSEDMETARQINRLRRLAQAWDKAERDDDHLLRGAPLQQMAELCEQENAHLTPLNIEFVTAGKDAHQQTQLEKEARQIQELANAHKQTVRTRIVAVAFVILVSIFGIISLWQKQQTETVLDQVRMNLDFMNSDLKDALQKYAPTDIRVALVTQVQELSNILQAYGGHSLSDQQAQINALLNKLDIMTVSKEMDPTEALPLALQVRTLAQVLVTNNPNTTTNRRLLSLSLRKLINIYNRLGQTDKALEVGLTNMAISQSLVQQEPKNTQFQQDLAASHEKLGSTYHRQGQLDKALEAFLANMAIIQSLVQQEPNNTQLQQDLASSHGKLGYTYNHLGKTDRALAEFLAKMTIVQALVQAEPDNIKLQRILSTSHLQLGITYELLELLDEALPFYQESMNVRQEIVQRDPENILFKRDLADSLYWLGHLYRRLGETPMALEAYQTFKQLSHFLNQQDPDNYFTKGYSPLAFSLLADVYLLLEQDNKALVAAKASQGMFKKIVQQHPADYEFQKNFAENYVILGDIYLYQKNTYRSIVAYKNALDILAKLLIQAPNNIDLLRDQSLTYYKMSAAYEKNQDYQKAVNALAQARNALMLMQDSNILMASDLPKIDSYTKKLTELKQKIADS